MSRGAANAQLVLAFRPVDVGQDSKRSLYLKRADQSRTNIGVGQEGDREGRGLRGRLRPGRSSFERCIPGRCDRSRAYPSRSADERFAGRPDSPMGWMGGRSADDARRLVAVQADRPPMRSAELPARLHLPASRSWPPALLLFLLLLLMMVMTR